MADVTWHRWEGQKLKQQVVIATDGKTVRCGWYDHLRMVWCTRQTGAGIGEAVEDDDFQTWEPTHYAVLPDELP
jgi:hypothetical protein